MPRNRCYACFRPKAACFCAAIPQIDNRTNVLILQHVRERFHPFNTARMVHRALNNSTLLVDQTPQLAAAELPLKPRAGLLYPGPEARLLSDLAPAERPDQLVIVDGTWHHAKTLVRDIPALHDLPRYGIVPASPGRYRIRREPTDTSLSTVEATVAALRALEPETPGLDQLLEAFDTMIERQLAHPRSEVAARRKQKRKRTANSVPRVLVHDLDNIVVAYGESACGVPGTRRTPRSPIYWVAQRLGTGECFARAIQPNSPLTKTFLGHLELTPADFADALSNAEFRTAWSAFLRPTDIVAVYSQSTARLLKHVGADFAKALVLKSIPFNPHRPNGTLAEVLAAEGQVAAPPQHPGRAGKRLANAVALTQHLNAMGSR
jgi:tRNA-uridine aminocarboxypropyltransferase